MDILNDNLPVIIAALAVLGLLILVLLVWRAISPRVAGRRGQRLGISEYHELDKTRRLVLVRRDDVEHLILIGGPQDVVVESGIALPSPSAAYGQDSMVSAPPAPRPAPRPAVFGDRRSPPPLRPVEPQAPPLPPLSRDNEPR